MKVKVTDKSCGLEAGKEYDLAEMSAKGLIEKGQAVQVVDEPDIKKKKAAELRKYAAENKIDISKAKNKGEALDIIEAAIKTTEDEENE